jgi:hypothetical protein
LAGEDYVSIGEIGDALRQLINELPFEQVQHAIDLLGRATAGLAEITHGSQTDEPAIALAYFARAMERLVEGQQTLSAARSTIERFIANLGADGRADNALAAPSSAPIPSVQHGTDPPIPIRWCPIDATLVTEVRRLGYKISPDRVVRIGRDRSGRVVWLEQGNSGAGVRHILEPKRTTQFAARGVAANDIVDLVFRAATKGTPIGISGRDRVVYEVSFGGQTQRVAVTIGDNGFIVGANPIRPNERLKPLP